MNVVTMLSGTDEEYTAFTPEGILDRWALRRLARAPGFEFKIVWAFARRDFAAGVCVDWPGKPFGTILVRRRDPWSHGAARRK